MLVHAAGTDPALHLITYSSCKTRERCPKQHNSPCMQARKRRQRSDGRCRRMCWPHTLSWRKPRWQMRSMHSRRRAAKAVQRPAQQGSCITANLKQVTEG